MPSWLAFDPGTDINTFKSQYDPPLYAPGMPLLETKAIASDIFSSHLQQQQYQLMTPPASPISQPKYSPFDQVPYEILDEIIGLVHDDNTRGIYDVLRDISSCCLVSRQFHTVAINWLYRHVCISDPYAFTKVR